MKIGIVQSKSSILAKFGDVLTREGYDLMSFEPEGLFLPRVKNGSNPDIILVDLSLHDSDIIHLCRTLRSDHEFWSIPILILGTEDGPFSPVEAIEAGCDDFLPYPILPQALLARVRSLIRLKTIVNRLDDAESVLSTLARTIEAKDPYTMGHADRVAQFSVQLGKSLGVRGHDLETLKKGGMLHDVGKIAIPDAILLKPGKYTPEEFAIMKKHPALGCEICGKLRSIQDAIPLIRHHHERLNGTGYPDKLQGDQISPLTRIITVVDIYDALRSKRSYKEAFDLEKTFKIMWDEVNKGWWDKSVLKAWENAVRTKKIEINPPS